MKVTVNGNDVNWALGVNTLAILFYISMNAFSGIVCALWMYGVHFFITQGNPSFSLISNEFYYTCLFKTGKVNSLFNCSRQNIPLQNKYGFKMGYKFNLFHGESEKQDYIRFRV